jgi:hypothetical protein
MTKTRQITALGIAFLRACASAARSDEFSRLEGPPFFNLSTTAGALPHASLSIRELDALPTILRDERAALVIVKTDQGNLAKGNLAGRENRLIFTVPVLGQNR